MVHFSDDDVYPATRITAAALGEPGRRVFLLQAHYGEEVFTWVIEKGQATGLSHSIPELLLSVKAEFPELGEPLVAAQPRLGLAEPFAPEFRVGQVGVTYDRLHDLIVLVLVDARIRDENPEGVSDDEAEAYQSLVYITRGQAVLLAQQAEAMVAAGRPACPDCGEPIDDFGHFCLPEPLRGQRAGIYLH